MKKITLTIPLMIAVLSPSIAEAGRYKYVNSVCTWVADDSGPNQCTPGRWKVYNGCRFFLNDSGPNQCVPQKSGPYSVSASQDGYYMTLTIADTDGYGSTIEGKFILTNIRYGLRTWSNLKIYPDGKISISGAGQDVFNFASTSTHCSENFHWGISCCDTAKLNKAYGERLVGSFRQAYAATVGAGFGAGFASRPLAPAVAAAFLGWAISFTSYEAVMSIWDCYY